MSIIARNGRRIVGVLSALAVAGVLVPTSPAAADSTSAAAADNWIVYASSAKKVPAGTPTTVIKGVQGKDGVCLLSGSGELKPGQAAAETHELAFNPATCESKVATVILTKAQYAARLADEAKENGETVKGDSGVAAAKPASSVAGPEFAALASESGYSQTYYEDPPGIDVTRVRNDTWWNYSGGCVTSATGGWNYHHFGASGWSRQSDNFRNTFTCYQAAYT